MIGSNAVAQSEKLLIKFSRIGIASKGVIYCILGILSFLAAIGYKKSKIGKGEVFSTILDQAFGKTLLIILTIGLLGYVVWCIIQTVKDPYHKGTDAKGIFARAGYLLSGLIYLSVAILAGKMALSMANSRDGANSHQKIVSELLSQSYGQWLVGITAVGIIAYGIYQIYKGITRKFLKNINQQSIDNNKRKAYEYAGMVGFISRGLIFVVIGYLFIKAAINSNASQAEGTEGAFDFISKSFGPILVVGIAIGLFAYGIFMFVKAKYAEVHF